MAQPSLFISHGAPDIAVKTDHPSYRFLCEASGMFPRPDAIVILSAHWTTDHVMVSSTASYKTIYDFGGFDPRLYAMQYSPKGNPDLSRIVLQLVRGTDGKAELVEHASLDHGAWIPLLLMYPEAYIPVVQVSIQPNLSPAYHYALGEALQELRQQNVLIIGSGAMTHNLSEMMFSGDGLSSPQWVADFADWMRDRIEAGDREALLSYREQAPHARRNHPTEEHILPLFLAMGAGGGIPGKQIHTATSYGTVRMDAYAFGM
ncbi:MAG: dioxygenase [Desulforhopalus sp.]|nr:dioxygenase [Desulforhopalus sp.]